MKRFTRPLFPLVGAVALFGCSGEGFSESSDDPTLSAAQELPMEPIDPGDPIDPAPRPPRPPLPPPPPPPPSVSTIVSKYQNYDMNADGIAEIESLKFLAGDEINTAATKGLALVLYDPRLVTDDPNNGISGLQMRLHLSLMRSDMFKEGFNPRFIEAKVYRGAQHQDGRTLLAMRRFLKEVHANHPLKSVTLIGDFPESIIVRQVLVRSRQGADPKRFGSVMLSNVDFVATGTELVAPRSDLILSDLDGNWENVSVQQPTASKDAELVPDLPAGTNFPAANQTLTGARYNIMNNNFRDFFLVRDRATTLTEAGGQAQLFVSHLGEDGPELSAADRQQPNPIARPEIEVSRINPRHVAMQPYLYYGTSTDGQGLLGTDGKPRVVRLTGTGGVDWREDATLERRILADYLYRNHAFRLGNDRNKPYPTSAVRAKESGLISPASFNAMLRKADSAFSTSWEVDEADMAEYINWLKTPAVLRGVAAHSNETFAEFAKSNAWLVDAMVGGKPWYWKLMSDAQGNYLQPTIGDRGSADFFLYRTLWENKVYDTMGTGQSFYIHDGCTVNGVFPHDQPYNTPNYAARQHAESMLFYANGLGMLARAKVFNDTPRGATEAINSNGKRFAASLKGYFTTDAADANLNPNGTTDWANRRTRTLQRKRTYFWGLLGDATLNIRYP